MRVLLVIAAGCIAISLMAAALKVAAVIIPIMIVYGFITQPFQTLAVVFGLFLMGLMARYPVPGMILFSLLLIVGLVNRERE